MIKMFVMDVDGTLTDGKIYVGADGELMKAFDVKDGYAIAHILPEHEIIPVIITGRDSKIVANRARDLGIHEVHQGVSDKIEKLNQLRALYNIKPSEIAYIGDDVNDEKCIQYVGLSACPCDAVTGLLCKVNYVCKHNGGSGAVREFIDYLITEMDGSENL